MVIGHGEGSLWHLPFLMLSGLLVTSSTVLDSLSIGLDDDRACALALIILLVMALVVGRQLLCSRRDSSIFRTKRLGSTKGQTPIRKPCRPLKEPRICGCNEAVNQTKEKIA